MYFRTWILLEVVRGKRTREKLGAWQEKGIVVPKDAVFVLVHTNIQHFEWRLLQTAQLALKIMPFGSMQVRWLRNNNIFTLKEQYL